MYNYGALQKATQIGFTPYNEMHTKHKQKKKHNIQNRKLI